ncbi:MAG: TRAP transporter substrate-binding protein [Alphaproteobacteria bacterium]
MKRREILLAAASVAAGAVAGAGAASTLSPPTEPMTSPRALRMVTTWPRDFPGLAASAERLANRIAAGSAGRFSVDVFHAGEAVPPYEAFDAVSTGAAELYHGAESFWRTKDKAYHFFASIPFGLSSGELSAWLAHGGGQSYWDELSATFNVKPFLAGHTGMHIGGWFTREIRTPKDLVGLRVRMPDLAGHVLERLGAVIVSLPIGEALGALKSGDLDGVALYGPWIDRNFGFSAAAPHYYLPDYREPGLALSCGINLTLWNGLDDFSRTAIASACAVESAAIQAQFQAENALALEELSKTLGGSPKRLADPVLAAFAAASEDVVRDLATSSEAAGRVADSYRIFRRQAVNWARAADAPYLAGRSAPL